MKLGAASCRSGFVVWGFMLRARVPALVRVLLGANIPSDPTPAALRHSLNVEFPNSEKASCCGGTECPRGHKPKNFKRNLRGR